MLDIRIQKREWVFVVIMAIVLCAIAFIPQIVAFRHAPADAQYMMTLYPVPDDTNSYFTWIRQATDGHFFFNFKYSSEAHIRALFHPIFLSMGLLVKAGIPLVGVWYGTQVLSILLLVWTLYVFISRFFIRVALRRFGLAFISLAGGWGFLHFVLHRNAVTLWTPADISMTETTLARSISWPFIFCFSVVLILWSFLMYMRYLESPQRKYFYGAAAAGFAVSLIHPYDAGIIASVAGLYTIIRYGFGRIPTVIAYVCIVILPTLYHAVLLIDPVFRGHSTFDMSSPNPVAYLGGFGILVPLAVIGAVVILLGSRFQKKSDWLLPIVWAGVLPLLLYAPVNFQRRMIEGGIVAYGILAVLGMQTIWQILRSFHPTHRVLYRWTVWGGMSAVVLISMLTVVSLFSDDLKRAQHPSYPYVIPKTIGESMTWLDKQASPDDVILSAWATGSFIPRLTGSVTYIGHGAQTYKAGRKSAEAEKFFSFFTPMSERDRLVIDRGITYVVYGPYELRNQTIDFSSSKILQQVYDNGEVKIFKRIK